MSKTIIVSNRLPVKLVENEAEVFFIPSEGGLATGLGSIYQQSGNVWVGWPGLEVSDEEQRKKITTELDIKNLKPVFLSQDEINQYYEGFSNEVLWPVFHYMPTYARYQQSNWDCYLQVNRKF